MYKMNAQHLCLQKDLIASIRKHLEKYCTPEKGESLSFLISNLRTEGWVNIPNNYQFVTMLERMGFMIKEERHGGQVHTFVTDAANSASLPLFTVVYKVGDEDWGAVEQKAKDAIGAEKGVRDFVRRTFKCELDKVIVLTKEQTEAVVKRVHLC